MKTREFRARYRLLKRITQRGVITYHALDDAGHFVMAHVLPGRSAEARRKLLSVLDRLDDTDRLRFKAAFDVEGHAVIVTDLLEDFESFDEWLRIRIERALGADVRPAETKRSPTPGLSAGADRPLDEFDELFGAVEGEEESSADEICEPTLPADVASRPPGEFTLLFGETYGSGPESGPEVEEPSPEAATPVGDFTALFASNPDGPRAQRPAAPRPKTQVNDQGTRPSGGMGRSPKKPVVRWKHDPPKARPVLEPVRPEVQPRPLARAKPVISEPVAGPTYRSQNGDEYLEVLRSGPRETARPPAPQLGPEVPADAGPPLSVPPSPAAPLDMSAPPSEFTLVVEGRAGGGAGAGPNESRADDGASDYAQPWRPGPVLSDRAKLTIGLSVLGVLFVLVVVITLV